MLSTPAQCFTLKMQARQHALSMQETSGGVVRNGTTYCMAASPTGRFPKHDSYRETTKRKYLLPQIINFVIQ
jgi:hypothetical protein